MNRLYIVCMSLLVVVGVAFTAAANDTIGRIIGVVMALAGLSGVFAAIMSRRRRK
ncbi:putative membrane protein YccC [Arthrobacter sp. CG_A4]|nr:putative membrane protein YccC [Arthrobacter sp. CG_A4]